MSQLLRDSQTRSGCRRLLGLIHDQRQPPPPPGRILICVYNINKDSLLLLLLLRLRTLGWVGFARDERWPDPLL